MSENRLSQSASAYLQSAAHQPIDWYEFGDDAFERARSLDRPILLDIGAVWCHWCHVIDRESYENAEIAELINAHYIAVKVDRDQRPDIDSRYQQVIASMTGQGGWPLTAFLTPDGRVLFGGTYFPPQTMKKLLNQVKDIYQEQKGELMHTPLEEQLSDNPVKAGIENKAQALPEINATLVPNIIESAKKAYDKENGGFGHKPKFPHFSTLQLLIQQAYRGNQVELVPMLERTLSQMAFGGIYDHIGGGFHRYSVDAEWHVPHFEKMAYDNAEALTVYSQAYRLTGNPLFRDIVEGIFGFVEEVLSDTESGGFYASQDADINLEDDGDYFTWSLTEIDALLTSDEAKVVTAYYNLTPDGDMHGRPGRNVLRIRSSLEGHGRMLGKSTEELQSLLESAYVKMAEAREQRPQPFVDKSQYLNWNGMLLTGYFEAADLLNHTEAQAFAIKTLDRLRLTHVDPVQECLLHAPGISGFMEDYAWFISALLKGYQSTAKQEYLAEARHWARVALQKFENTEPGNGGYYDIEELQSKAAPALLRLRRRPIEDTPSSSANAVMINNLLALSMLGDEPRWQESAARALGLFTNALSEHGIYVSALGIALFNALHPPLKLEVVGTDEGLIEAARQSFSPGKIIKYLIESKTKEIRICHGTRCLPPVTSADALNEALESL